MNNKLKIALIFAVMIALYVINYFLLKIALFQFTGVVIALLIVGAVIINIVVKLKNRKSPEVNDNSFILPKGVANKMNKVDMGIQYEASILSLSFLIVGMILFSVYFIFFTGYDWAFKAFYLFNSICGIVLMISMLVSNYQQYVSYKESKNLLTSFSATSNAGEEVVSDLSMINRMKGGHRKNGK